MELLKVTDVAQRLKIAPSTVYELVSAGLLRYVRMGSRGKRFTEEMIDAFIKENTR